MYWYIAFVVTSNDISATCMVLMLGTCTYPYVWEREHLNNIPFHLVRTNVWAAKSVPWGTQHNGRGNIWREGEVRKVSNSRVILRESIIILMARG